MRHPAGPPREPSAMGAGRAAATAAYYAEAQPGPPSPRRRLRLRWLPHLPLRM